MKLVHALGGLAASLAVASAANAQQSYWDELELRHYVRASGGYALLSDSDNQGNFTEPFELGLDAGTVSVEEISWSTEFDGGTFFSAAYGVNFYNNWRAEVEVSFSENDIDTHKDVTITGFGNVDGLDVAVILGPDQETATGSTIGEVLSDGQGSVENLGFAANFYGEYDFFQGTPFTNYIGFGLGVSLVNVKYNPSGVQVVRDDDTVFLYQFMVGGEYDIAANTNFYAGYRYRATTDVSVEVDLFPAELDVEYGSHIFEAGLKINF